MLSTFERSWLCKIEKDENGILPEMQITVPYATSTLAVDELYTNIEAHSFFEVTMVLFSLMHKSNELFKTDVLQLPIQRVDEADDENDDVNDKNKDSDYKPPNNKIKRSNSGRQHSPRFSIKKNNSSVTITPSHSTSPISKPKTFLKIPDFSHVNSLDVWSCKQGFLGSGRWEFL